MRVGSSSGSDESSSGQDRDDGRFFVARHADWECRTCYGRATPRKVIARGAGRDPQTWLIAITIYADC